MRTFPIFTNLKGEKNQKVLKMGGRGQLIFIYYEIHSLSRSLCLFWTTDPAWPLSTGTSLSCLWPSAELLWLAPEAAEAAGGQLWMKDGTDIRAEVWEQEPSWICRKESEKAFLWPSLDSRFCAGLPASALSGKSQPLWVRSISWISPPMPRGWVTSFTLPTGTAQFCISKCPSSRIDFYWINPDIRTLSEPLINSDTILGMSTLLWSWLVNLSAQILHNTKLAEWWVSRKRRINILWLTTLTKK